MRPPETISTERLVLRKPVLDDAQVIFHGYACDADVTKYLVWRPHKEVDETEEFLARCIENWSGETEFTWVIESKQAHELMGMIACRIHHTSANLGYVLARKYWNKGFMSEAVGRITDWMLSRPEIFRVWAECDLENIGSARVLENVGMQREGVLRRWIVLPNIGSEPRDCWCYSKVR